MKTRFSLLIAFFGLVVVVIGTNWYSRILLKRVDSQFKMIDETYRSLVWEARYIESSHQEFEIQDFLNRLLPGIL